MKKATLGIVLNAGTEKLNKAIEVAKNTQSLKAQGDGVVFIDVSDMGVQMSLFEVKVLNESNFTELVNSSINTLQVCEKY